MNARMTIRLKEEGSTNMPRAKRETREALIQRLQQQEAHAAAAAKEKAELTARLRALDAQERWHRQAAVGKLAEEAGLPMADDVLLHTYFRALARVRQHDPEALQALLGLDAILTGDVRVIQLVGDDGLPLGGNGVSPLLTGTTEEDDA